VHVIHYPGTDTRYGSQEQVVVRVWTGDKPSLQEQIAMANFLASIKKLQELA